ncbi:hypothetical protein D7X94_10115 [Acutalibacter sp. 1XD8-33]|uniref:hypothetical protein n=1 Tax=Acutalibacter sp. 1XD8-33 TaxID=2320081 RepID=UPI000EA35359|nr:hypothetical protein [Acutalibacter sp. 1XD8-33]RKJ39972.1 hypothetical protein D7X94_10115 [Acutalibacter sp. 1XD8-33]
MTNPEKNEARMNALTKAATFLSKFIEIAYTIGAVSMAVCLILFLVDRELVSGSGDPGQELAVHGFSLVCVNPDGTLNSAACVIFFVTAGLILELMAWVFRNVNLILRTTQGLTKFSRGKTPFQKDNVRMLREIGIFFLSVTVVEFAASSLVFLLVGPENAEVSAGVQSAATGILMLCLSQVFALGVWMQADVDGLV